MKVSTLLRKAREWLTPRGRWCQGAGQIKKGRRVVSACTVGVFWQFQPNEYSPSLDFLCRATGDDTGTRDMVSWNDSPRRKKREVLALFAKAERLARKEGQ